MIPFPILLYQKKWVISIFDPIFIPTNMQYFMISLNISYKAYEKSEQIMVNNNINKQGSYQKPNQINKIQRIILIYFLYSFLISNVIITTAYFIAFFADSVGMIETYSNIYSILFELTVMLVVSCVLFKLVRINSTIKKSNPLNLKNAGRLQFLYRSFSILFICLLIYSFFIDRHGIIFTVSNFSSLIFSLFILACLFYVFHKIFIGIIKMKEDYDLTI